MARVSITKISQIFCPTLSPVVIMVVPDREAVENRGTVVLVVKVAIPSL